MLHAYDSSAFECLVDHPWYERATTASRQSGVDHTRWRYFLPVGERG